MLRDGEEVEIAADALGVGDVLVVRPGERIAADGSVVAGRSAVDQAVLTGEGLPVDKGEGDPVYTGTFNQFGRLEVRAEKVGHGDDAGPGDPPAGRGPEPAVAAGARRPTATPGSSCPPC